MPPEQLTLDLYTGPANPQELAEQVAAEVVDYFGINEEWKGTIKVKDIRAGRFMHRTQNISIPAWAHKQGEAFFRVYVAHEVAHAAELLNSPHTARSQAHSPTFKKMEDEVIAELWDMKIIRRRVYPKRIIQRGKTVWMEE